MKRLRMVAVLVLTSVVGLVLPLEYSEAREAFAVKNTLKQMPVTGRLADGGTFAGRLTVQALTINDLGQLSATGVLTGTAIPQNEHLLSTALCALTRLQE